MAGKPGMKGGGGARKGAGRKPKALNVELIKMEKGTDPKEFLLSIVGDECADPRVRIDAAKALLPYTHPRLGEGGKKDQKQDAAAKVAGGKFAAAPPPKLVINNR